MALFILRSDTMDFITSNNYLDLASMTLNALYVSNHLLTSGWTKEAIAGLLGNVQTESTINPGLWENRDFGNMSNGYGLVQWTPATKYINWANARGYDITGMDGQLARIDWEVENNEQWAYHPTWTFYDYTQSDSPPYDLAMLFLKHYERPLEPNQPLRGTQAEMWYEVIFDLVPHPPKPKYDDFFLMTRKNYVRRRR